MVAVARARNVSVNLVYGRRGPEVLVNGKDPKMQDLVSFDGSRVRKVLVDELLTRKEVDTALTRLGIPRDVKVEIKGDWLL